ncbi:MAG: Gfo/Idh/MocA family protein, partial [Burkholderiales bacterium]
MKKLRAAVIGVGRLGRHHAAKYAEHPDVDLVAVADVSEPSAREVAARFGCRALRDFREALPGVDLVSVAVPTERHAEVVRACLEAGVHVLVEKPITRTVEEADALIALAAARGLHFAVGHIERYNPAFMATRKALARPLFIESERLAEFQPRVTDIDVILDLMIHDIDLALSLAHAEISVVIACGFKVITDSIDIATAHIEFADGAVAQLSASRVSQAPVRKLRVFGRDGYASADLHGGRLREARRADDGAIVVEEHAFPDADALRAEIASFVAAVRGEGMAIVSGTEGRRALALALEINERIAE